MKILVLNGPNINLLGIREPEIYGNITYETMVDTIRKHCIIKGISVEFYQSNHEGDLIDRIQQAYFDKVDGIVFNPAAYTHTSIAIADALKAVAIPTVEVHISDIATREKFRMFSYVESVAQERIIGRGIKGYLDAIDYFNKLQQN